MNWLSLIWGFVKNPKNLGLLILGILLIIASGWILLQRTTIAVQKTKVVEQAKDIEALKKTQQALMCQIKGYEDQVGQLKKQALAHQKITNDTAKLMREVEKIKTKCIMEKGDEKIINDVVDYFNNGLRR